MLTPAQLRAARALLNWSREKLASESGTGAETVKNFELRGSSPTIKTAQKWRRALQIAGVIFQEEDDEHGPGVRLRKDAEIRSKEKGGKR